MKKNILIFGITSQDGAFLSKLLIEKKYSVNGTTRNKNYKNLKNLSKLEILNKINIYQVEINNYKQVFNLIKKIQPIHIYNFAGVNTIKESFDSPLETFNSIVKGNLNILNSIKYYKNIKFFSALSAECFGYNLRNYVNEKTIMKPSNPYGYSKKIIFNIIQNYRINYNLKCCAGILFNHESVLRSNKYVTTKIIKNSLLIKKRKIKKIELGNINSYRDWGWAPEYVEAMFKILFYNKFDEYIIATGKTYRVIDFIKITFDKLGLNYRNHLKTIKQKNRRKDNVFFIANTKKIEKDLKWKAKKNIYNIIDDLLKYHE